jgi:lysozyme
MNLDETGLELIKQFEGIKLKVYRDPVGLPTVGVGHVVKPSEGLQVGDVITEAQMDAFLRADVGQAEQTVNDLVQVPLKQKQFSALVSFTFNVGRGALSRSTLLRKLNAGDYDGAAAEFNRWTRARGRTLPGLVRRRAAERSLFESEES